MINQKTYRVIPDPSAGVFDTPGSWAVLREAPGFRTNLAPNPSAEASGSDGWFQGNATIYQTVYPERSTAQHLFGVASFKMVGNDATNQPQSGFYFTPSALGHYVISVWMMKTGNLQSFEINTGASASDTGFANQQYVTRRTFSHTDGTTSSWFRFSYSFDVTDMTDKFIRFRGNQYQAGETFNIYMDGILVERAEGLLDYFDGSFDYAEWHGVPNNSISSIDYTRQEFDDFGFTMTALVGGNGPQWNTISTPYAFGGGYYQRSTPMMTEFSIVGTIEAQNRIDLERKRRAMQKALSPRLNLPVKLVYQPRTCDDDSWTKPLVVEAVYMSGLEGNLTNEFQETIAINFRIHTPYVATDVGTNEQDIVILKELDVWGGFIRRDPQGVYHQMNFVAAGLGVSAYVRGPDNRLYVAYTVAANNVQLYVLDETNLAQILIGAFTATSSSPEPCRIYHLRFGPDGKLWAAGNFNAIGGVTKNNLAAWDGSTWTSPVSSIAEAYFVGVPTIQDIGWITDGTAYVVGNFSTINGSARKNFAKYTVAGGFEAVSPGFNGADGDTIPPVLSLLVDDNDDIWVYGRFSGSGGNNNRNLWRYRPPSLVLPTGSFFSTGNIGASDSEEVLWAIFLNDGNILTLGTFTSIKGDTTTGYAIWTDQNNYVSVPYLEPYFPPIRVSQNPNGIIEMGYPTTDTYTGGWLQWNGGVLIRPEYRPSLDIYAGNPVFDAFVIVDAYPDGTIYLYGTPHESVPPTPPLAHVPNTNVIVNEGDINVWPTFAFIGALNLFNITNATTGVTMHFDLLVSEGEVVTMEIYPQVKLTSTLRGDVTKAVLAGSQTRDFVLVPGINNLNFGADAYGETDTRIVITWKNRYDSLGAVFE